MDQKQFEWLHQAQMEIMDEVHRICVDEGITYYLIAGSVIGALRHKGFIPWDFDIDCAMPRPEYNRFKEACQRKLNPRFRYFDYHTVSGYTNPHALVGIVGTKLNRRYDKFNNETFHAGIYLDVFPLDAAPDTVEERADHAAKVNAVKRKIYIKRHYNYNGSIVSKFGKWVRSLRYVGVSIDKLNEELDVEMRRYENAGTHYLCSMAGRHPYENECSPSEWFGTPVLGQFEDRQYYIPQEADKYLTKMYGDYMQLPPESEQKADMDYFETVVFDKEYD